MDYTEPVSRLLTLGEPPVQADGHDYRALGLGPEHIPELIRLIGDEVRDAEDFESPEGWAPIHAQRALGQLRAEAAVEPLLGLLWRVDELGDEWVSEEIPEVLTAIGPAAIPAVTAYLSSAEYGLWARVTAAKALAEIGKRYPDARSACVAGLVGVLEKFAELDPTLNAELVSALMDLDAVEAAPVMERAFAADAMDLSVAGDWEEVQVEMGLLAERRTPPPPEGWLPFSLGVARRRGPATHQEAPAPVPGPAAPWKRTRQAEQRRKQKRVAQKKQKQKARKKKN